MKIGVTSQNFRTINGHAGKNRRFLVYATDADGKAQLAERMDLPKAMSLHEYHGDDHPLFALDVLVTGGCGDGFRRRMESAGVRVVTTAETDPSRAAQAVADGRQLPPAAPHDPDHGHAPGHGHGHQAQLSPFKVQLRSTS